MGEARTYRGQGASAGSFEGPAFAASDWTRSLRSQVDDAERGLDLGQSIDAALEELKQLSAASSADAAAIVEYQIEMLSDPVLEELARPDADDSNGPVFAWVDAVNAHIFKLSRSTEERARACASDVIDIKRRVLNALTGSKTKGFPAGACYVGADMAPSVFIAHDWSAGGAIALFDGSAASHVAMLARANNIPMVVGLGEAQICTGARTLIDGSSGVLVSDPQSANEPARRLRRPDAAPRRRQRKKELRTADGVKISVGANVNIWDDLDRIHPLDFGSIGLLRSEFLLPTIADLADEERQFNAYRHVMERVGEMPVNIRMFDLGGDKQIPGGGKGGWSGSRGVRLLLEKPEMARVQIRSLLRSAPFGDLRVLMPFVTSPEQYLSIKAMFAEQFRMLRENKIEGRMPALGIMVETPAAAMHLDLFGDAEFFALGTNDLLRHVSKARDGDTAASVLPHDAMSEVLLMARMATAHASAIRKPITICGDAAADPHLLPLLLQLGLRSFSVAPSSLAPVRHAIARYVSGLSAGLEIQNGR